jgi:hypothetical protein
VHTASIIRVAVRTSETTVYFNETTGCYIPEGYHLRTRRRENLKSHVDKNWFVNKSCCCYGLTKFRRTEIKHWLSWVLLLQNYALYMITCTMQYTRKVASDNLLTSLALSDGTSGPALTFFHWCSSPMLKTVSNKYNNQHVLNVTCIAWSWGSSVSIVSDYRLHHWETGVRSAKNSSSSLCVQTSPEAHPASYPMGTGGPFTGTKERPGRDADHSPPSSAEVKNE